MNYKLEGIVEKITSPVICIIDGQETEYQNGKVLCEESFNKYYLVVSISARGEKIVVSLKEKDRTQCGPMNWIGEEAI